jgi:HSP20 family protein
MSISERREVAHRLFPDLLDWIESPFTSWRPLAVTDQPPAQAIRVEDYVESGTYVVRAELPDIDPDKDVEITVTGDVLRIHAERQTEKRDAQRSEFRYGSFTRALALPRGVAAKDIKASYDKGILTISVPMPEAKETTQRVAVEAKRH